MRPRTVLLTVAAAVLAVISTAGAVEIAAADTSTSTPATATTTTTTTSVSASPTASPVVSTTPSTSPAPVASTARGWCVRSGTGELRNLWLVAATGKCPAPFWGPTALGAGATGPQGPAGPAGPKGDTGPAGTPGADTASAVRVVAKTLTVTSATDATYTLALPDGSRLLAAGHDAFKQPSAADTLTVTDPAAARIDLGVVVAGVPFKLAGQATWPDAVTVKVTVWAVVLVR